MRHTFVAFVAFAALSAPVAHAQTFDPGQCARIRDVELPYRVAVSPEAITFTSNSSNIIVNALSISANGRTHTSPSVANYHQKLSQFLNQAETMGRAGLRAANPFARRDASLGDAATNMCQAILELDGSAAIIEGEFNGYASPVQIQLR